MKDSIEKSVFGVCTFIGELLGIASSRVRLYFIYFSFVALGSPIIVYLVLAFWINIKKYIRAAKTPIME